MRFSFVSRLRRKGANGNGKKTSASTAVGNVSVKTTATICVALDVEEFVVMVSVPSLDEQLHEAPAGKLRHWAETFVAEEGSVTAAVVDPSLPRCAQWSRASVPVYQRPAMSRAAYSVESMSVCCPTTLSGICRAAEFFCRIRSYA